MLSNPISSSSFPSLEFCTKLPKIELHAHLNGCIRRDTLKELALAKGFPLEDYSSRDLPTCFKIFAMIHKVMTDLDSIHRVTREMLEDFSSQNVVYLEIRTTPKVLINVFTFEEYLETILSEIVKFQASQNNSMIIRLWFSVDRSKPVEQAQKTLELLEFFQRNPLYSQYILGLDYSGNPYLNSFRDFSSIFEEARLKGFKTAIHIAETEGEVCKQETLEILQFKPDRLGHFNFFDKELLDLVFKLRIPLEICPSSNYSTVKLNSMKEHHFGLFFQEKYPMSVCTDDTGVFDTDLSREVYEIWKAFGLDSKEVKEFLERSMECILEEIVRKEVEKKIMEFFK